MSSVGLNIGLRGLLAAQSALDTIGHNITNANTKGYSRQRLQIDAARPMAYRGMHFGGGVVASSISRSVDSTLTRRIVAQVSTVSRLDAMMVGYKGVESLLGEPSGTGIGKLMSDWFGGLSELSTDPKDPVFRTGVTQSASSLTTEFNRLSEELETQRNDVFERIDSFLTEVNARAEQIGNLNVEIAKIESAGGNANDLRDERDLTLSELGKQVDITYHEDPNGSVRVLVDGQLLVGNTTVNPLSGQFDESGLQLFVKGGTQPIIPTNGEIGGMLEVANGFIPHLSNKLDTLARSLIFETNRMHSVGVPADGGFKTMRSAYPVQDSDNDGQLLDERLDSAGLPFDIQNGQLYVNVTDDATGSVSTKVIEIDPFRMTVGDLVGDLDSIDGISARIDELGRLTVDATDGNRFDFSRRLEANPGSQGTFGSGQASHGSALEGPFELLAGSTLDLVGPVGAFTVTFDPGQFEDMAKASAEEVAAAINAEPGMQANFMRAVADGDRVFLQTIDDGADQTFTIAGGTALGVLGFAGGTVVNGHDTGASIEMGGAWNEDHNDVLTFRPLGDGEIGTTPGLKVEVVNQDGFTVATLDVGEGYLPGNELDLGNGLNVSFGVGVLSATDGDQFSQQLVADSDTADVLASFGMNSFYVGTDAGTIAVRDDIVSDPSRLSASASGASGDNGVLLDMLALQTEDTASLGMSLGEFHGGIVSDVGFKVSSVQTTLEVEQFLQASLEERQAQVSGVNVDEELVDMIQFEQAYGAAAQFLQVVNEMHDEVLNLL